MFKLSGKNRKIFDSNLRDTVALNYFSLEIKTLEIIS